MKKVRNRKNKRSETEKINGSKQKNKRFETEKINGSNQKKQIMIRHFF